jgi:hypothetical protein
MAQKKWTKHITVDKNVIGVLSQSTYKNFPRALKELITNSYDADARNVNVNIDVGKQSIIIEDDGYGMDEEEFSFYLTIAGKKRTKTQFTPLGRDIIGQFGVGFLAVFPFFRGYEIETKKIGTTEVLHASIPLYSYFDGSKVSRDIESIAIEGNTSIERTLSNISFTRITLSGFNEQTKFFFAPQKNVKVNNRLVETYPGIEKLKWVLSDDLPLQFEQEKYNAIFALKESTKFNVVINDSPLKRKIYGDENLEKNKGEFETIGDIQFRYCITTPRKSVVPKEAQGLKIRNLNVGIGEKREFFGAENRSRLHWLSGELHIISGMNNLLKVSRDDFNFSQDYEALKDFFKRKLSYFSTRLENEDSLNREIKDTGKDFRVQNVNLLKPEAFTNKLKKFESEGFKIKSMPQGLIKTSRAIVINEERKEILISEDYSSFSKAITVGKKRFKVTSESWDISSTNFPACRIEKGILIVNSSYPLFKGKKYTDVFLKLHVMLLMKLDSKEITKKAYESFMQDILNYFSDY